MNIFLFDFRNQTIEPDGNDVETIFPVSNEWLLQQGEGRIFGFFFVIWKWNETLVTVFEQERRRNKPNRCACASVDLLWSVLILSSNWLRVEIDRGLITVVFGIIVVRREAVGERPDRFGLAI